MDPGWVDWKVFWMETVMVRCSDDHIEFWFGI